MNFFNIIKKGTNKQLESLKSSAIYEIAAEKLEPKPYSQLAKPLYVLSQYFSVAYHFISYSIALIGITLYAFQLDSFLHKIILIVLSFILLAIVEIAKSNSSNTVFSSIARKESLNKLFLIVLLVTTVFSFCTSVWSAKESIYFASTNQKFSNIDSLQNSQIDSINALFATQISSIQTSIESNTNTLKTSKNKWLKLATNKDLQASQNQLTNVLKEKEKALLSIQNHKTSSYQITSEKGKEIALFAAVLFALFELLNLVAYWFVYQYYQSCLLESNLPNEQPNREQPKESQTHGVTSAVISNPFMLNPVPTFERKIGFQFGYNDSRNEQRNEPKQQDKAVLGNGNRICLHCKELYTYKIHNQKYCSSECRIEFWQKKTGKKLIKK